MPWKHLVFVTPALSMGSIRPVQWQGTIWMPDYYSKPPMVVYAWNGPCIHGVGTLCKWRSCYMTRWPLLYVYTYSDLMNNSPSVWLPGLDHLHWVSYHRNMCQTNDLLSLNPKLMHHWMINRVANPAPWFSRSNLYPTDGCNYIDTNQVSDKDIN